MHTHTYTHSQCEDISVMIGVLIFYMCEKERLCFSKRAINPSLLFSLFLCLCVCLSLSLCLSVSLSLFLHLFVSVSVSLYLFVFVSVSLCLFVSLVLFAIHISCVSLSVH